MSMPKAYSPAKGYQYQILTRNLECGREWEHCDYAENKKEKDRLIGEYRFFYGVGFEFKTIPLPQKYWQE